MRFRQVAEELSSRRDTFTQEDIFFASPRGRLKLRMFAEGKSELIYYERLDQTGPKLSRYWISRTSDPEGLCNLLGNAFGIRGTVRKIRELFVAEQTRLHLDEVEELGTFAELEVVMREGQTEEDGIAIASHLMQKLSIADADLIDAAYLDWLEKQRPNPAPDTVRGFPP